MSMKRMIQRQIMKHRRASWRLNARGRNAFSGGWSPEFSGSKQGKVFLSPDRKKAKAAVFAKLSHATTKSKTFTSDADGNPNGNALVKAKLWIGSQPR